MTTIDVSTFPTGLGTVSAVIVYGGREVVYSWFDESWQTLPAEACCPAEACHDDFLCCFHDESIWDDGD